MTDDERKDLLELKVVITSYLADVEQQILDYSPYADRNVFDFMILKARRYAQVLAEIDRQLPNKE